MGIEIEHKYLVKSDAYKHLSSSSHLIIQGYLCKEPSRTVRVRICDNKGYLTIKGKTEGDSRVEFEYEIPLKEAEQLMEMTLPSPIRKRRWIVIHEGRKWEIDEFLNRDVPVIAEVELDTSTYSYSLPSFVGKEVTGDPQYYNSNL